MFEQSIKYRLFGLFYILYLFFLVILILIWFFVGGLQTGYYNEFDALGLVSRYPLHFLLLSLSVALLLVLGWYVSSGTSHTKIRSFIFLAPVMTLIMVKYVLPEVMDSFYITNFYDAPAHMQKGLFVANVGHSDVNVDGYFDLQPSFFWLTAIILNIINSPPLALTNHVSLMLIKWFHLISITIYIPMLYLLYRQLFGNKLELIFSAIFLQFSLEFGHFHYAAQSITNALYWLILATSFAAIHKKEVRHSLIILLCGLSIIFMHQGIVIMTIISLTSLSIYPIFFKKIRNDDRFIRWDFLLMLTCQITLWLGYLMYMTVFTFKDFTLTLKNVFEILMTEATAIIPRGIARANKVWQQIVIYKSLYIFTLIALGITTSFINAYRRKNDTDELAFCIQILSTVFFGGISVALGGAGYVERLPSLLLPLIVYSTLNFILGFQRLKEWKIKGFLASTLLAMIIFSGVIFYMSGRNFQSITYGEYYSNAFLVNKDPQNIMGLYGRLEVTPISKVIKDELSNKSVAYITVITIQRHDIIQTNYYIYTDTSLIKSTIKNLQDEMAIIYNNPDTVILLRTKSK